MQNNIIGKIFRTRYWEDREQALEDRNRFTTEELDYLDVDFPDGAGETNEETYIAEGHSVGRDPETFEIDTRTGKRRE